MGDTNSTSGNDSDSDSGNNSNSDNISKNFGVAANCVFINRMQYG